MRTATLLAVVSGLGYTLASTTVITWTSYTTICPTEGTATSTPGSGTSSGPAPGSSVLATSVPASISASSSVLASSVSTSVSGTQTSCSIEATPTIDLGYTLHQGTINQTGAYYNFSNIRYGEAPVGDLRWAASIPPQTINRTVDDGSIDRICPQAGPNWENYAGTFLLTYLEGGNVSKILSELDVPKVTSAPTPDPRTTEDCLFLDVIVPEAIYNSKCDVGEDGSGGAPVLVWIYGGGYTGGSKEGSGNPAGLLAKSESGGNRGLVYVAMNYRLGAFGWLSGSTFQEDGGIANAGLYDQRLALEWIQTNIHLFGGDPSKVTVMGESAGAGSIMHQITAYGGTQGPAPFAQAIAQSPGWQPSPPNETVYEAFLAAAGVSTLAEARSLDTTTLQTANYLIVGNSAWGTFSFGPVIDGVFAPELPGVALLNGNYDKSLVIMAGHNADEGILFTSPFIQSDAAYDTYVSSTFPNISSSVVSYITDTLYPAVYDGTYGYTDETARASLTVAEVAFTCNTNYLAHAFGNLTYNYYFTQFPALHGEDVAYTFYNGQSLDGYGFSIDVAVAEELQAYLTAFAETGTPDAALGVPYFSTYGANSSVQDISGSGTLPFPDPVANPRCTWWQQALYL